MINNLAKIVLERGGRVKPLVVPFEIARGTGQTNPSLLIEDDRILVNLRCVQYFLLHSENEQKFPSRWGPLAYMNPENDRHLRTKNIFIELDPDLEPLRTLPVDTSKLDVTPVWEFIGLEDARMVNWDGKYYYCGVRRDTKPNGEGRMEMSEIQFDNGSAREVSRFRIEPPVPSYCEKNWMPVLDIPFHFVKWTNPTEVVKVDLENLSATTVHLSTSTIPGLPDLRGGSSVIRHGDYYFAITHEVNLFNNELGQKDAFYYHRFVIWDLEFNLVRVSDRFDFMDARIEFCCGMGIYKDKALITFGFQDNAAYVMEMPLEAWEEMVWKY